VAIRIVEVLPLSGWGCSGGEEVEWRVVLLVLVLNVLSSVVLPILVAGGMPPPAANDADAISVAS